MHQTGWTGLVADLIIDPPRSSHRLLFADAGEDSALPRPRRPRPGPVARGGPGA